MAWGGEKIPLIQTKSPDEIHPCWIGAQSMPNIWGPSRKLKQLSRHVPYNCMWNVFKRLPFGRPTYIVFPFHPTLVQTFINCWAITIGSQPDSPMRIHHLCRIYTLCMAVTSALNCCSCNVTRHSKSTNGSHCRLNQPEFPPAGTRSAPRLTLHPISYCPPTPIMPLFLQPTAPSFPRNSMTQACVCVSMSVVPALENVPSLSVPPPQFSLILPSLGALPYSHPDGPFLLSTLLVLWQCLMVVSTISSVSWLFTKLSPYTGRLWACGLQNLTPCSKWAVNTYLLVWTESNSIWGHLCWWLWGHRHYGSITVGSEVFVYFFSLVYTKPLR